MSYAKDSVLILRISDIDKEKLKLHAQKMCMSMSDYARMLIDLGEVKIAELGVSMGNDFPSFSKRTEFKAKFIAGDK